MSESQHDHRSEDSHSLDKTPKDLSINQPKPSDAPTEDQGDGGASSSKQTRSWRFWLTMFALFLGMFVANLDATIIGKSAGPRLVTTPKKHADIVD
jgi:hypothetical protein